MKIILISILFTLALAGCMGYVPGQQSYWDAQVREMCAKDGGTKIFEVVQLSEEQYKNGLNRLGHFDIPLQKNASVNSPFAHTIRRTNIRDENPYVWRHETSVIRLSDNKILGTQVIYSRVGGDFPSPTIDSSFSCPDKQIDLFSAVLKRAGDSK